MRTDMDVRKLLRLSTGRREEIDANAPLAFPVHEERLQQLCAVWSDGRCLIAHGYEDDPQLMQALDTLKQKGRLSENLRCRSVGLEEIAEEYRDVTGVHARVHANDDIRSRVERVLVAAANARASDVVFENDGQVCRTYVIVNDAKIPLGNPMLADEGRQVMGYLFHAKDEGSAQTSYQRNTFQGFSIRAGGTVPLPSTVSGMRCQRGPHDPDGDHMFCRLFYRDRLETGMTLERLGFTPVEAAVFAKIRMSRHGGVFLGGSTGDGKSTTLATNLALQMAERRYELNLVTLEDPVEYRVPGALQIAVPTSGAGEDRALHFKRALMHFCRIHPASGMVSEIRDGEAARQVIQFIDTGHQVWTTIHVDNANAILFRLLDMGVEAPALTKPGNVALLMKQTLLPLLCGACSLDAPRDTTIPDWMEETLARLPGARFRNRSGCVQCRRVDAGEIAQRAWTGYRHQSVVAEMIIPDSGYLQRVAARDPQGAWDYWINRLDGMPIARRIWELVQAGEVDPFDALSRGARIEELMTPVTAAMDAPRLVHGDAS